MIMHGVTCNWHHSANFKRLGGAIFHCTQLGEVGLGTSSTDSKITIKNYNNEIEVTNTSCQSLMSHGLCFDRCMVLKLVSVCRSNNHPVMQYTVCIRGNCKTACESMWAAQTDTTCKTTAHWKHTTVKGYTAHALNKHCTLPAHVPCPQFVVTLEWCGKCLEWDTPYLVMYISKSGSWKLSFKTFFWTDWLTMT